MVAITPEAPEDHQDERNYDLEELSHRIQTGHILLDLSVNPKEREGLVTINP